MFLPAAFILLSLGLASCATPNRASVLPMEFPQIEDKPLPKEVASWLEAGEQSILTPEIIEVSSTIHGRSRRERLRKAVDFVWKNLKYDSWLSYRAFARTSGQLFSEQLLGGCSDYALAQVTLFRALKIPARLVVTANSEWMLGYQKNDLLMSTGHVFIEAYLEDRWYLVDSTYRFLFTDYDLDLKSYPRQEYFYARGRDYWDLGSQNVAGADRILRKMAVIFEKSMYIAPHYTKRKI